MYWYVEKAHESWGSQIACDTCRRRPRLQQIVRQTRPGDVLFFSFSGYGLQVDDMDGYQDEGYEEAILPTDFVDGRDGDYSVICTNDLHDVPGLDSVRNADKMLTGKSRGWLNTVTTM